MANAKRNGNTAASQAPYKKSTVREYAESICIAVVLALFVRTFAVQAFKIPTGSMENNLLIGDHLLVNKFVFAPTRTALERMLLPIDPIRRGDILVFKFPEDPERDFIKRVIGLPGETLEMREKKIYIDGKPIDEPYVHFQNPIAGSGPGDADFTAGNLQRNYGPVTVPEGFYFMMGDNRDNSQDSRYWGFLTREYVKGKALFIYASYSKDEGVRWRRFLHQIH
jgi:signal peptidase I